MLKIATKSSTITLCKIFIIIIKCFPTKRQHYNKTNKDKFDDNNDNNNDAFQ